jgi:glycosyltransferase involved in cell wall biosynthesis
MIEAMACGTPVIAWRNGAVPEVIRDRVNGFIVDSVEGAVDAVQRIGTISRQNCRKVFEQEFDSARMAKEYVEVYRQLARESTRLTLAVHVPHQPNTRADESLPLRG